MKSLIDIANEAESSLEIPIDKPAEQLFFCPVGLVGAGKTTVTKVISEKLNLIRLSSDELRKRLKENGYDYSPVKEIGLKIATRFAHKGYSIAFDMDCGNPEVKEFVENLSKKLGAKTIFVHVTAPESYIFDKFRKHPPTWLANDPQIMIDNHVAQKEKRLKENTKFDYLFTFDTSRADLQRQIVECLNKINKTVNTP